MIAGTGCVGAREKALSDSLAPPASAINTAFVLSQRIRLYRKYWTFFWPLALTGLALLLARQFRNGALARYPEAAFELAVFAVATSLIFVFAAAQLFLPQMSNLYVRTPRAYQICLRFTLVSSALLTIPLLIVGLSSGGKVIVGQVFNVEGETLDSVIIYIRLLCPLVVLMGLQRFYIGLLVQGRFTGKVTVIQCIYLAAVIGVLVLGFQLRLPAVLTITFAQLVPATLQLLLLYLAFRRYHAWPDPAQSDHPTYRELFDFYWPVALTSFTFALSRPTIYSFVSQTPNAILAIAALRITFDLSMLFRSPLNEFRHLLVTFGADELRNVGKFMFWIIIGVTGLMIVAAGTPVSTFLLHDVLGVSGSVLALSKDIFWILCLMPIISGLRNYLHGASLLERRTRAMGGGGIFRLLLTYAACQLTAHLGILDHRIAALIFVLGFLGEALAMILFRKLRVERPSPQRA